MSTDGNARVIVETPSGTSTFDAETWHLRPDGHLGIMREATEFIEGGNVIAVFAPGAWYSVSREGA
jgi:hypothetical protein